MENDTELAAFLAELPDHPDWCSISSPDVDTVNAGATRRLNCLNCCTGIKAQRNEETDTQRKYITLPAYVAGKHTIPIECF